MALGTDPLIWRLALSAHCPADLAALETLPTRLLFQAEVVVRVGERHEEAARREADRRRALDRVTRG